MEPPVGPGPGPESRRRRPKHRFPPEVLSHDEVLALLSACGHSPTAYTGAMAKTAPRKVPPKGRARSSRLAVTPSKVESKPLNRSLHAANYDAVEVPYTDAIPSDFKGAMGVPISFLDRYNPEQFEILGITDRDNNSGLKTKEYSEADAPNFGDLNRRGAIRVGSELVSTYARLLIRYRRRTRRKGKTR